MRYPILAVALAALTACNSSTSPMGAVVAAGVAVGAVARSAP